MSAWKIIVRSVQLHGPVFWIAADGPALKEARRLGLLAHDAKGGRWALTALGHEWCEGRVEQVGWRGGRRWAATWLRALPKGTRI